MMARAIVMPSYGMYVAEGTLAQWLKASGEQVEAGELIAEIETEKATADVVAPEAGILHHVVEPGAALEVESLIGYILAPGEAAPSATEAPVEASGPSIADLSPRFERQAGEVHASPNARRLARELGVDLARVDGTGPGGRITEVDVRGASNDGGR